MKPKDINLLKLSIELSLQKLKEIEYQSDQENQPLLLNIIQLRNLLLKSETILNKTHSPKTNKKSKIEINTSDIITLVNNLIYIHINT